MRLDQKDRRLLFLLERNSRAALTQLGGELRLSREAVNYRMRKLQSLGIIKSFIVKAGFERLGLVNNIAYLKLGNMSPAQHAALIAALGRNRGVTWLASLGGRFDLAVEMPAPGMAEADALLSAALGGHAPHIRSYVVSTRVFQRTFGRGYLWPERAHGHVAAKAAPAARAALDGLDRKILSFLSSDARMPVSELAGLAGEAPSTVSWRLKQLERTGAIEGYTTFSDMSAFGYSSFKVLVSVHNFSRADEGRLLAFCESHPNVYYVNKTMGAWNFELEADFESPQRYQEFLLDFRSRFDGFVQDVESLSIFREHVFRFWPH